MNESVESPVGVYGNMYGHVLFPGEGMGYPLGTVSTSSKLDEVAAWGTEHFIHHSDQALT